MFDTYGRDHAALCSTVIRYRAKGALRDVGKALCLPEDLIKMLSSQVWGWSREGIEPKHAEGLNLNLGDRRLRLAMELARELIGTPRHLSQHPGGFVLTHDRLDELVPIEPAAMKDRQVIEWDKDDIDALRFMKVDCLALGMLSCMKRGLDLLAEHKGIRLDLATIPAEDPDYGDLGQAFPAWTGPGRDAILQPPKPEIRPSPHVLQRAADRDADPEAAEVTAAVPVEVSEMVPAVPSRIVNVTVCAPAEV